MTKRYVRDVHDQVTYDYLNMLDDVINRLEKKAPDTACRTGGSECYQESVEYYPPGQKEWSCVASMPPGLEKVKQGYYDVGGIEVIDYIQAKLTPEQFKGYLLGNIYKYSGRMQYKGEETKDLNKLGEYTHWLKEFHESNA